MFHLASVSMSILGQFWVLEYGLFHCKSTCAFKIRYLGPPDLLINDYNNFLPCHFLPRHTPLALRLKRFLSF
jgi:hypothetical protein